MSDKEISATRGKVSDLSTRRAASKSGLADGANIQHPTVAEELEKNNRALAARVAELERQARMVTPDQAELEVLRQFRAGMSATMKDAARYRWLRNAAEAKDNPEAADAIGDLPFAVDLIIWDQDGSIIYESGFGTDAIDEAIDAALSDADGGNHG